MRLMKKIIIGLFVIFLLFSLTKNFFEYMNNHQFYQSYKENFEKEKKKNIELKTALLKKESFYEIEKIIRNKLNLSLPGEVVVLIPSPAVSPTPSPTPAPPIYRQWLNLFAK